MTYAQVTREQALAEKCPTCEAKPGEPCFYTHDSWEYAPSPDGEGRVKRLAHSRGQELPGTVHSKRKSAVKNRRAPRPHGKKRGPYGLRGRLGLLTDEEIYQQVSDGYSVEEVARRAGLSEYATRQRYTAFVAAMRNERRHDR